MNIIFYEPRDLAGHCLSNVVASASEISRSWNVNLCIRNKTKKTKTGQFALNNSNIIKKQELTSHPLQEQKSL